MGKGVLFRLGSELVSYVGGPLIITVEIRA